MCPSHNLNRVNQKFTLLLVIVLLVLPSALVHAQDQEQVPEVKIKSIFKEIVPGMPCPVVIKVTGETELPYALPWNDLVPFSFSLKYKDATMLEVPNYNHQMILVNEGIAPSGPDDFGEYKEYIPLPTFKLAHGKSTTMTLDLACREMALGNLDGPGLKMMQALYGQCVLTLHIENKAVSTIAVDVKKPNVIEKRIVERVIKNGKSTRRLVYKSHIPDDYWSFYILSPEKYILPGEYEKLRVQTKKQLYYHKSLADMVNSGLAIKDIKIEPVLKNAPEQWAYEIKILAYEIYLQRGDTKKAQSLYEDLMVERPMFKDLLDHIKKSGGMIARFRSIKKEYDL